MAEALEATIELEHTCGLPRIGTKPFQLIPAESTRRLAEKYGSVWDRVRLQRWARPHLT